MIASADLTIKRNDTREALRATLESLGKDGKWKAIDLTAAEAIHLYLYTAKTEEGKTRHVKTGAVTITDAEAGEIEYQWEADDLAKAGTYQAEFEITWEGGGTQTVPNDSYYTIEVIVDLGPVEGEE